MRRRKRPTTTATVFGVGHMTCMHTCVSGLGESRTVATTFLARVTLHLRKSWPCVIKRSGTLAPTVMLMSSPTDSTARTSLPTSRSHDRTDNDSGGGSARCMSATASTLFSTFSMTRDACDTLPSSAAVAASPSSSMSSFSSSVPHLMTVSGPRSSWLMTEMRRSCVEFATVEATDSMNARRRECHSCTMPNAPRASATVAAMPTIHTTSMSASERSTSVNRSITAWVVVKLKRQVRLPTAKSADARCTKGDVTGGGGTIGMGSPVASVTSYMAPVTELDAVLPRNSARALAAKWPVNTPSAGRSLGLDVGTRWNIGTPYTTFTRGDRMAGVPVSRVSLNTSTHSWSRCTKSWPYNAGAAGTASR